GPVDVGYRDLRAARRESQGSGAADARSRTRYQGHLAVESHVLSSRNRVPPLVVRGRRSGRESTTNACRGFLDLKARNGATSLRRRRSSEEDDMARSVTVQTVAGM